MYKVLFLMAFAGHSLGQQYQQKMAPGVPPQTYQQQQNYQQPPPPPPPQQQYQPPPPQQQQMNQQQQQFQQQPPQQQQVPVQPQVQHQGGHGHHHQGDPQLLNTANIQQERDHIQEHMDVPIDTSKMSEQELQFHYFKMHDNDNNNKLDGCELIKSLIHWHADDGPKETDVVYKDKDLEEVVETALKSVDTNNDGFIDYSEYKLVAVKIVNN